MRRVMLVLSALVFAVVSMVYASNDATMATSTGYGIYQLSVTSVPSGAHVYIDGAYRGRTPLQISLWQGTYSLRVEMSGYRVYEERFTINRNINKSVYLVHAVRTRRLTVTSSPSRAEVFIDGSYVGRTPLSLSLEEGTYDLLIGLPGYWNHSERVRLTTDRYLDVTLTPDTRPIFYRRTAWLGDIPLDRFLLLSVGLLFVVLALMY